MNHLARTQEGQVGDEGLQPICADRPDSACRQRPGNVVLHVISRCLTRIGEGLAHAKLFLAWLLDRIGAPAWVVGLILVAGAGSPPSCAVS